MQKLQILFPDPMMRQLKEFAVAEDRPVSEIVRRAVERTLRQSPSPRVSAKKFPVFHGGGVLVSATEMKEAIYADTNE